MDRGENPLEMVWLSDALAFQHKAENATILEDDPTGNANLIQLIECLSLTETAYWQPRMLWREFHIPRACITGILGENAAGSLAPPMNRLKYAS